MRRSLMCFVMLISLIVTYLHFLFQHYLCLCCVRVRIYILYFHCEVKVISHILKLPAHCYPYV